jgi:hypothetical protein
MRKDESGMHPGQASSRDSSRCAPLLTVLSRAPPRFPPTVASVLSAREGNRLGPTKEEGKGSTSTPPRPRPRVDVSRESTALQSTPIPCTRHGRSLAGALVALLARLPPSRCPPHLTALLAFRPRHLRTFHPAKETAGVYGHPLALRPRKRKEEGGRSRRTSPRARVYARHLKIPPPAWLDATAQLGVDPHSSLLLLPSRSTPQLDEKKNETAR